MNIKLLPENLINQIAAGEVVERPASVVKEMMENSIDAGASFITLEVKNGGVELLRITDNGSGMSEEDAKMAFERHATSKIASWEDLQNVSTMGFRGEALASIASVAKVILATKKADAISGVELVFDGGQTVSENSKAMQAGTEITVENLFYNTPARLKFLKTEATEYQKIVDTFVQIALAHPEITLKLIKLDDEEKVVLNLPATTDSLVRIRGIMGKGISDQMVEIFYGGLSLAISGFIGKPEISRSNRNQQYFYVNNRPISSHVLSYAVKQAYHSLLPKERYPAFVIFFEMAPSLVDVNCHPQKKEVKFKDEKEVFRALLAASSKALENAVLNPKITQENLDYYQARSFGKIGSAPVERSAEQIELQMQNLGSSEVQSVNINNGNDQFLGSNTAPQQSSMNGADEEIYNLPKFGDQRVAGGIDEVKRDGLFTNIEPLAQLNNSFILAQKGEDLVIIDQHAAHERIRYEQLISEKDTQEKAIQPLLMPVNIELSATDISALDGNKSLIDELGIKLEFFGGNTFSVVEVPNYLVKTNLDSLIRGLIDDLRNSPLNEAEGVKGEIFGRREKALTYLACRSAIKFGDKLDMTEMKALVEQLALLPLGKSTCPHGRPIMIEMEKGELMSRFGRKYSGFFEKEKFGGVN